jgi:hypothetical protein
MGAFLDKECFTQDELEKFKLLWTKDRGSAVNVLKFVWAKDKEKHVSGRELSEILNQDEKYIRAQLNKYGFGWYDRIQDRVLESMSKALEEVKNYGIHN